MALTMEEEEEEERRKRKRRKRRRKGKVGRIIIRRWRKRRDWDK